jgi:ubiquinone/menaquinone biosynthesis C-methylase UbiE
MSAKIWDFWADRYDRLWVQKHSLGPTREYILEKLEKLVKGRTNLLDLGCGPGELLHEIGKRYPKLKLTGVDYSERMLEVSRKRNIGACHELLDAMHIDRLEGRFDLITCTHSLPYYRDPKAVLHKLSGLMTMNGRILVGFASGDSVFDKVMLSGVKLTTGKANYPSDDEFRKMVKADFNVLDMKIIKRAFYMPRIAVYTLSIKTDNRERC